MCAMQSPEKGLCVKIILDIILCPSDSDILISALMIFLCYLEIAQLQPPMSLSAHQFIDISTKSHLCHS